jgi:predicted amidohydrolase YtcJ
MKAKLATGHQTEGGGRVPETDPADIIIIDAQILTMDDRQPRASAIAIRGGAILAVGDTATVREFAGPMTRVVDAAGRSVLPGINESHIHIFSGAAELGYLSLFGMQGLAALTAAIRAHAGANPALPLLICTAVDYTALGGGRAFDRHVLDGILQDRPLALMSPDHHTVWANTAALRKAGLLHGRALPPGNRIVMGEDGLASGELQEHYAFDDVIALTPTAGRERLGLSTGNEPPVPPIAAEQAQDKAVLRRGLAHLARHGITSFQNMDGNRYTLELLGEIECEGGLICRARVPFHHVSGDPQVQMEKAAQMARDFTTPFLTSGMVKFFMDGVLDSHTAVMAEDYADRPGWRGESRFDADTFVTLCTEADARGLQIAVHSIGDGATAMVLDSYAAARRVNGNRDSRHRIEHLEVVREQDFQRLKELDVIASMQPPHPPGQCGLPLEPTLSRIGAANWPRAYAWRRMLDSGIPLALSSDWPVSSVNPWASIHAAVTRRPWKDDLPDNRLTREEAIRAYTVTAAFTEFAEGWKGMIRPGYAADVILIDRNLDTCPDEDLHSIETVLTICGGRVTYDRIATG